MCLLPRSLASDPRSLPSGQVPVAAAGGSRRPFGDGVAKTETLMQIADGKAVFIKAVDMMAETSVKALERAGLTIGDVDHWIPHQANARIIGAVQARLGLAGDKIVSTVSAYANSSAATIPLSLSLAAETRLFKPGDRILMCAAGAGMTAGAVVFRL